MSLDVKGALCGLTHAGTVAVEVKEVDSDVVVAGQQVKFVVEVGTELGWAGLGDRVIQGLN